MYTYTPEGGMTQTFETEEKRDAYAKWHQGLRQQVEREVQRMANEQARKAKSAADSAAFEAAERLFGENARVNERLSHE